MSQTWKRGSIAMTKYFREGCIRDGQSLQYNHYNGTEVGSLVSSCKTELQNQLDGFARANSLGELIIHY